MSSLACGIIQGLYLAKRDNLQRYYLGLGCLFIERETSVNFCGDTTGDDGEDLLAEFDQLMTKS